jgi:hypothetical protein
VPKPRQAHRAATRVLSLAMVGIGAALIVLTLAGGGGPLARGLLLGLLFVALGAGRLYVQARTDGG